MTKEKQLAEWIEEALSGILSKNVAVRVAPVVAKHLIQKSRNEHDGK